MGMFRSGHVEFEELIFFHSRSDPYRKGLAGFVPYCLIHSFSF